MTTDRITVDAACTWYAPPCGWKGKIDIIFEDGQAKDSDPCPRCGWKKFTASVPIFSPESLVRSFPKETPDDET